MRALLVLYWSIAAVCAVAGVVRLIEGADARVLFVYLTAALGWAVAAMWMRVARDGGEAGR